MLSFHPKQCPQVSRRQILAPSELIKRLSHVLTPLKKTELAGRSGQRHKRYLEAKLLQTSNELFLRPLWVELVEVGRATLNMLGATFDHMIGNHQLEFREIITKQRSSNVN